jgi:hypothetical protein
VKCGKRFSTVLEHLRNSDPPNFKEGKVRFRLARLGPGDSLSYPRTRILFRVMWL